MPRQDQLRRWFLRKEADSLSFDDFWKIFLIRVCDRATDVVDEHGSSVRSKKGPYFYDLRKIADDDKIPIIPALIPKIVEHLIEQRFAVGTKGSPNELTPTYEGNEKAIDLLNSEIFIQLPETNVWGLGAEEDLTDWLLVHALNAKGSSNSGGLINFRKIADHHPNKIKGAQLKLALEDLERNDYVMSDIGPDKGRFWRTSIRLAQKGRAGLCRFGLWACQFLHQTDLSG